MTNKNMPPLRLGGLGLTENDSQIYVFLLERGTVFGGSKIAARLELHRQYVHYSLQKLVEMELVEEVRVGARKAYRALPPQQLSRLANKRLEYAEHAVRELEKISSVGAHQDFEVFKGTKQVFAFEEAVVQSLKENEEQYIIGGGAEAFISFFGDEYEPISRIAYHKHLRTQYVGCPGEESWLSERVVGVHGKNFAYRILNTLPKTIVQTVVRFDTVTFYAFGNPPLVYVVKSKTVAEDYKKLFDMLWSMAGER